MHRIALTSLALLAPVLVAVPASAAGESCDGRAATIVVTLDPSSPFRTAPVVGTAGDDVIVGTAADDTIDGAGGNDVICGLDGADDLTGGDGDDRLFGGLDGREDDPDPAGNSALGDLVRPGPGDDVVDLGLDAESEPSFRNDQVRYDDSATAVRIDLTPVNGVGRAVGEGTDTIVVLGPMTVVGSPFDDHVIGSPYDDTLMTDRGSDVVMGGDGDDAILPDIAGYDVMETADPEGADFASADTVDGGAGDDVITAMWGRGDFEGGVGDDYLRIGEAEFGGNATNEGSRIAGGAGDDTIDAELIRDLRVSGGGGDDEISHSVYGGAGRTTTSGGAGDDHLELSTGSGLAPRARITVDRSRSRIVTDRTLASIRGYERYVLAGPASIASSGARSVKWAFVGTNARDDVVTAQGAWSLRVRTFAGRDHVEGTQGRDLLDLGRGVDRAAGDGGRDTCIDVERATNCEIRR